MITATSPNTPTAVRIIVASARENNALFSPKILMIWSAIFTAAPDWISTPARIPDVTIRRIAGIMLCAPVIMQETVPSSPAPPITPPTKAPAIILYAGSIFLIIRIMATARPISAPIVVIVISISATSYFYF